MARLVVGMGEGGVSTMGAVRTTQMEIVRVRFTVRVSISSGFARLTTGSKQSTAWDAPDHAGLPLACEEAKDHRRRTSRADVWHAEIKGMCGGDSEGGIRSCRGDSS